MDTMHGYRPLKNILFADDFDKGLNGWINLMPNFRQDIFNYYPASKDGHPGGGHRCCPQQHMDMQEPMGRFMGRIQ